jgi:hypothetical protein
VSYSIVWFIGGVYLKVTIFNNNFASLLKNYYKKFQISVIPDKIEISINIQTDEFGNKILDNISSVKVEKVDNGLINVYIPDAFGVLQQHEFSLTGNFIINQNQPDVFIIIKRILIAIWFEHKGGLLLHSSGVFKNGKVWLFCGPSGAGKSTIATDLKKNGKTFSHDESVLTFKDGRLMAHFTPFMDYGEYIRGCPDEAEVAGIVFIDKADHHRLYKATTARAIYSLLTESRWYEKDQLLTELTLSNIKKIVETGLCYRLEFKKDDGFWPLLDNLELSEDN